MTPPEEFKTEYFVVTTGIRNLAGDKAENLISDVYENTRRILSYAGPHEEAVLWKEFLAALHFQLLVLNDVSRMPPPPIA